MKYNRKNTCLNYWELIKMKDPMWKHGDFGIWYDIVPLVMTANIIAAVEIIRVFL